ncbi:MAG: hypothetical protein OXG58_00120 [Gemmatimonadetes bacterium]|nr:hypothetical protein [Gemmatimonadota bacterium]MCY3942254.1 hypothetical protein [Gemmatimonadota bacterium]
MDNLAQAPTAAKRSAGPLHSLAQMRVAAIDAGSNAIRFVAADFLGGSRYSVVGKTRRPVRLGHGVFTTGRLDDATVELAAKAFRGFRQEIDAFGVERYRAVGTSATREATNRQAFLDRILEESDIVLEPISGREEARLVHLAVRSRVDLSRGKWVLVDLGGGSVEVSIVNEAGILWSESYRVGTVRLVETLEEADGCHRSLLAWVQGELGPLTIPPYVGIGGPAVFAATGGNIEEIARLALGRTSGREAASLPIRDLEAVVRLLSGLTVAERTSVLGLQPNRADVIVPAALVYRHFARLAGVDRIVVPGVGVKEGVLLDVARRAIPEPKGGE